MPPMLPLMNSLPRGLVLDWLPYLGAHASASISALLGVGAVVAGIVLARALRTRREMVARGDDALARRAGTRAA